jgi:hypothetical protein
MCKFIFLFIEGMVEIGGIGLSVEGELIYFFQFVELELVGLAFFLDLPLVHVF